MPEPYFNWMLWVCLTLFVFVLIVTWKFRFGNALIKQTNEPTQKHAIGHTKVMKAGYKMKKKPHIREWYKFLQQGFCRSYGQLLRQFFVVSFLTSLLVEYLRMVERERIRKIAVLNLYHSICSKDTWTSTFWSFFSFNYDGKCAHYYQALYSREVLAVNPLLVVISLLSRCLMEPVSNFLFILVSNFGLFLTVLLITCCIVASIFCIAAIMFYIVSKLLPHSSLLSKYFLPLKTDFGSSLLGSTDRAPILGKVSGKPITTTTKRRTKKLKA